jgi:hypothetical protein
MFNWLTDVDEAKRRTTSTLFAVTLNYRQIHLFRELITRVARSAGFNVLRQTQTAYNRFKFQEKSPRSIKDSK